MLPASLDAIEAPHPFVLCPGHRAKVTDRHGFLWHVVLPRVRSRPVRHAQARVNVATLAEAAGVTTASLYAWANGTRNPTPENLARLADALEKRGGKLTELAKELREAAGEG